MILRNCNEVDHTTSSANVPDLPPNQYRIHHKEIVTGHLVDEPTCIHTSELTMGISRNKYDVVRVSVTIRVSVSMPILMRGYG